MLMRRLHPYAVLTVATLGLILWLVWWLAPDSAVADGLECPSGERSDAGFLDLAQGVGPKAAPVAARGFPDPVSSLRAQEVPSTWRLEVLWRLGGIDVPEVEAFGTVYGLSIGPYGQVLVLDRQADAITVFDRDGRFVRRFGRRGQGPGEFRTPVAMAWDPCDRLWVTDAFNYRYTAFDSTGQVLETVRRPFTEVNGWSQALLVPDDSWLLDESGWRVRGHHSVGFVRVDRSGVPIDSFPPLPIPPDTAMPQPRRPGVDRDFVDLRQRLNAALRELRPYRPRQRYTLTREATVWFGRSDQYRLVHRTLGGDTLLVLEPGHRSPTLSREDARFIRDVLTSNRFSASDFGFEFGRQIVQALVPLDDGRLLVQVVGSPGQDSALFDLFNGEGVYLGEVRFPVPVDTRAPPAVQGDTIVFVSRGEFDETYVYRGILRRVSEESQTGL